MKIFAERLKELRLDRKMTQAVLSQETKITQSTISGYEADKVSPTAEVIVAFSKFFDVSADYLLGLKDDE